MSLQEVYLSLESTGGVCELLMYKLGLNPVIAIIITMALGVLCEVITGTWLNAGVPAFIASLGGMLAYRGAIIGILEENQFLHLKNRICILINDKKNPEKHISGFLYIGGYYEEVYNYSNHFYDCYNNFFKSKSYVEKNQNQDYIKTGEYHFALILKQEDSYWNRFEEGAKDAAKESGFTMTILKDEYFHKSNHLDFIDRELESNVDGIISYSLNEESYKNLIDKCIEKGVHFVTVEEDTPKSKRNAYIGTNSYYIGNLLANRLLESIDYRGDIGVIMENKEDSLKLIGIHDEIIKTKMYLL